MGLRRAHQRCLLTGNFQVRLSQRKMLPPTGHPILAGTAGGRRRLVAMLESEIRFLPLGARRVAYEVRGSGPPLVAPAWWVSHLELDWQSASFRRFWEGVADGHTLIRYDRLGVGMSDRTLQDSDLTIDEEVATLRALLDELELERVSLVGGSCGSCTAIAFAATYPERVERLVLYGSYPDGAEITAPGVGDAIISAVRAHSGLCSATPRPPKLPPRCWDSSIASTCALSFPSSARRQWSCIVATTAPFRFSWGVRSRPRFPARLSSRCREARTSRGTAMSIPWCARAARPWHRRSRRSLQRARRRLPCCPVVNMRFLPASRAV